MPQSVHLHDVVALLVDLPDHKLRRGQVGTVVETLAPDVFEVEFSDDDGRIDLLIGVSDWREYGWDDAYDAKGQWTRGPVRGYVYFHKNTGTNGAPRYAAPVRLPVETRGSPSPTLLRS